MLTWIVTSATWHCLKNLNADPFHFVPKRFLSSNKNNNILILSSSCSPPSSVVLHHRLPSPGWRSAGLRGPTSSPAALPHTATKLDVIRNQFAPTCDVEKMNKKGMWMLLATAPDVYFVQWSRQSEICKIWWRGAKSAESHLLHIELRCFNLL